MLRLQLRLLCVFLAAKFVQSDLNSTLEHCCSLGKDKVSGALKCEAKIPAPISRVPVEQQSICLSAIDLCCTQLLRDISCKNGKETAKFKRSCIVPRKTDEDVTYKYCCEACKLGMISGSMSMCKSKTFNFGSPWDEVYESCCEDSSISKPSGGLPGGVSTTETVNICNLWSGELCAHICVPVDGSYRCQCRDGFTLMADGKSCREDIGNRCEKSNPCEQNCFDNGTSTVCSCNDGFALRSDGRSCEDIDECKEGLHVCNLNSHKCLNTIGSYRCVLNENSKPGFKFDARLSRYVDIDECQEKPCNSNEVCQNTIGSFKCECAVGFQLDKVFGVCIDINECQQNSHDCNLNSQRCDNTIGSYHCVRVSGCGTGYTFNSESLVCEDDDECALGTDNCRLLGVDWECRNTLGSFRCEKRSCRNPLNCTRITYADCPKGFEFHNKGKCVDINECDKKLACPIGQTCVNTIGSFRCDANLACGDGLRLHNKSSLCIDINECEEQSELCDHRCINTYGSFRCACHPGFSLHHDKRSCVDINECELYNNNRGLCAAYCINQPGSYKCQCPDGYNLGMDRASCVDIDECVREYKCNGPNETCLNMQGSYRCNSIVCPVNYVKDPNKKNRCTRAPYFCTTYSDECSKWPLAYSYNYVTFVSNAPIPESGQLELFHMKGQSSGTSSMEFVLELKSVQAPLGVPKVTREYFYLNRVSANEVEVSLLKPVTGPQDIELNLQMNVFVRGISSGFTVSKLFLFVSKYEF